MIILAREDSTQAVRVFIEVGTRVSLRATSAGLAILAGLEQSEIDEVVGRYVEGFDETVATGDELRGEITRTRERGYALNGSAGCRPRVASVGAAVTNATGRPIAALNAASIRSGTASSR